MPTFWSQTKEIVEPVRPYRFRIMDAGTDEGYWWWAKAATKPSFDISKEEYTLINHKFKYPGILTWKDVTIKIIDYKADNGSSSNIHKLYKFIEDSRYSFTSPDGISKDKLIRNYVIEQLDADGNIIEKWTLVNAFVTGIDNGELSYETETLSEITITVSYDTAELSTT